MALLVAAICLFSYNETERFGAECEEIGTLLQMNAGGDSTSLREIEGELELLLSFAEYNSIEKMGVHIKAAWELLGHPAKFIDTRGGWTFGSPSVLYMFHRTSGELARELEWMKEALPVYNQVAGGHGAGADIIMEAEASYPCGEFDSAEILAHQAFYHANLYKQQDIAICAAFLQMKLALYWGDHAGAADILQTVKAQTKQGKWYHLLDTIELCEVFLMVSRGQKQDIPEWIANSDFPSGSLYFPALAFFNVAYSHVLLIREDYHRLLGNMDYFMENASAVSGSTVTVTGTKTAATTLALEIPSGVTVLWKAALTGAVSNSLLQLTGGGTFELAAGEITNTEGRAILCLNQNLVISGGTVSAGGTVLETAYAQYAPALTMTGGTVRSTSAASTVYAMVAGGKTVISGGTVDAGGGKQILLNNAVVVYRSDLLSSIASGSLSVSVSVAPSKTYALPGEAEGLTATGYSATAGNVTASWAVLPGAGTGVAIYYTGAGGGSWQVSYPGVAVVGSKQSLTYDANGGSGSMTGATVYYGQTYTVSANAFTNSGYKFTGWNTQADGKGTPYAAGAVLTGTDNSDAVTLYAQWSKKSDTGMVLGGGGGGGTTTTPTTSVSSSTSTTTVTPSISSGIATGSVTASQMSDALAKAKAAAGTNGTPNVQIQVSGASGARSVGTTIPHASMQALASGGVGALTISGPTGSVNFGADALKTIASAGSGDVTIIVAKTDSSTLSGAAQELAGSHPVFTFNVTSGGNAIFQFGGDVTISVPYTLASGEDTNAIVIYYITADGMPTLVQNALYGAATGAVIFTTTHFSTYTVGYNKLNFIDVSNTAWYEDAVTFLAARNITSGTTATTFSPDVTLTRGQFITLLLRAYGIEAETSATDNFSDAGNTYYTSYLAAAKSLGISNGVGNNKFAPEAAITRQEMFALLKTPSRYSINCRRVRPARCSPISRTATALPLTRRRP